MRKRVYEGQTFERVFLEDAYATFCDMEFIKCTFRFCSFSNREKPLYRAMVQRMTFRDCTYIEAGGIDSAMVEDMVVENLKTKGLLQAWAMAFKHVTLRGPVGRIMIVNRPAPTMDLTTVKLQAWEDANAEYYNSVDWALDISNAEFLECDIRGIPSRLIRRDPDTQIVVTRQKALQGKWRELDLSGTYWAGWIDLFLSTEDEDVVLVAPKQARDFKRQRDGLHLLRDAGVAEPDP